MSRTDFGWTPRRIAPSLLVLALCLGAPALAQSPEDPSGDPVERIVVAHSPRIARIPAPRSFDVGGRLVRTLADRVFPPGEHDLAWDGSGDHGRAMPRGVYFSEIRYAASGFRAARKLIVLR